MYDTMFASFVPVGRKNAVDINVLSVRSQIPPRTARRMIEQINASGRYMILNLSDGRGYFIADESEKYLEKAYQEQEARRFMSLLKKLEGINLYLKSK